MSLHCVARACVHLAAEALHRLMSQTSSLLTFTRDNPLVSFVLQGVPSVSETRVDSKKVMPMGCCVFALCCCC